MRTKKITALAGILLGCAISVTACSTGAKESGKTQDTQPVQETEAGKDTVQERMTLEEASDFMVETAVQYGNRIEKESLLKGLEDRKGDAADGMDMLVIVSRAFGTLPEPDKSKKQKEEIDTSAVPEWALEDIENLKNAGVLKKSDLEAVSDPVSREAIEAFVQRVMDQYGN